MFTLGFPFYPWAQRKSIADGADICDYVKETAAKFGIDKKIEYKQKVLSAAWSTKDALWTVQIENAETKTTRQVTTRFMLFASGYYDYSEGYYPSLSGSENFKGQILQPQFWPEDLDYSGKKVVIIGSGATGVTLLPNMAKHAAHVTLLQRSPSYFLALPTVDPIATVARKILPAFLAGLVLRFQNQAKSSFFFYMCRWFPNMMRKILRFAVKRQLPPNIPLDPHFSPNYKPWDQRICMVPDGDMFRSMREGKASIATGVIDKITANTIRLQSGQEIEADIIVQATGLKLMMLGGTSITVDGEKVKLSDRMVFKGQLLNRIPNMSLSFGYTNASWSLGSDICSRYVCKLLNFMKDNGYVKCQPAVDQDSLPLAPLTNLNSGYLQRAVGEMPKSSGKKPWAMKSNYFVDLFQLKTGNVVDDMEFFTPRA